MRLFNLPVMILTVIIMAIVIKPITHHYEESQVGTECRDKVFYFKAGNEYIKADSQQFRILFTGEVVNAYFYKDNKEYSTMDYYKEYQEGTYQKVTKGNKTYYKCITNKN